MKGRPVDQIVYECMFPKPKSSDPQNFHALLQRNLIPEVRQETHAFYGHLNTQEAKYPGLDYSSFTHRLRLSRWPWHRRLFRAFDSIRLTNFEIATLTKWEGTKWAKEKFEREEGIAIRDTTADDFPEWVEPEQRPRTNAVQPASDSVPVDEPVHDDDKMDEEESDEELESVGAELNERLRAQIARREAGENSVVLDEEWEQWLKNAIETGELNFLTEQITDELFQRAGSNSGIPESMLSAARARQWSTIPESLQPILRRTVNSEAQPHRRPSVAQNAIEVNPSVDASRRFHGEARQPWSTFLPEMRDSAAQG